jgi:hypothetical protein
MQGKRFYVPHAEALYEFVRDMDSSLALKPRWTFGDRYDPYA